MYWLTGSFNKCLWLTCLFCIFIFSSILGQTSSYKINNYKTKDGLPQNSVKFIQFDKAGYCWIGTEMGIVRFDGKNFKVYDSHNTKGITSDRIAFAARDGKGNIYFQNDESQIFIIVIPPNGQAPYPKLIKTSDIKIPQVEEINTESAVLQFWADSLLEINKFLFGDYTATTISKKEAYLFQSDKLFFVKKQIGATLDSFNLEDNNIRQLILNKIYIQIYPDGKLKAWNQGQYLKNITGINGPIKENSAYKNGNFKCIPQGDKTYIYAGKTLYLLEYHDEMLDTKVVLDDLDIPAMSSVMYNIENKTYYIGSYISGLYVVSPSYFKYGQVTSKSLIPSFYAQVLTKDGKIFCQGYLYNDDGSFIKTASRNFVGASLYISPDQKIYYANNPVFNMFDLNANKETTISYLDNRLSGIFEDKSDSSAIILFTWTSMYRMRNDVIFESKKIPNQDKFYKIMCVVQKSRDTFLLGTQNGLSFYDAKSNKIFKTILNGNYIRSIYMDGHDMIWCSTYGKGYFAYTKGRVIKFPIGIFPALNTIHAFIDDGRGYFWLPTNDGLFKVKKNDLLDYIKDSTYEIYFYEFNSEDNLKTNEFNGGCDPGYIWLKDSLLSLPTLEGLVKFAPFSIHTVLPDKGIYISEIEIDGLDVSFPKKNKLVLNPGFTKMSINVSSPFFGNTKNLRLLYKIEGFYDDWQSVPGNGIITLNRIPSGNYKLIVKKLSGFGKKEFNTMELEIIVTPWFYFTWWFILIILTFLTFFIFQIIRYRVKRMKENNEKLQLFIDEQTRELSDTVVRLAHSERQLRESNQMKDRVTTMVLHDLRSPIRFIHLMTNQLSLSFQKYGVDIMRQRLNSLKSTTAALNQFTEQFFAWAASQHSNFKITPTYFDLNEVLEEINELYNDIILVNNNKLIINSTNIQLFSDRNILSVVLRNIVDNANNNTIGGEIELRAILSGETVVISIKDNGKGFDEEAMYDYINKNSGTTKGGHGSTIVYSLLEKINGELEIESQKDIGTIFKVRLNHYRTLQNN